MQEMWKNLIIFETSEKHSIKKQMFQPRLDEILGTVRVLIIEKIVDSFMSSNM
jgi:hypothetical protein